MPRIVKSSQVLAGSQPVVIDNRVTVPEQKPEVNPPECVQDDAVSSAEENERYIAGEVERRCAARMIEISNKEDAMLELAKGKADYIIRSAETEASKLSEEAKIKSEELFEQARRGGFQQGLEEGRKKGAEQCSSYIKAGARFLSEINARKEAYYLSHSEEMEELILLMVKKITLREIEMNPEILTDILKDAAKSFRNSDSLKISLAKGDISEEVVTDKEFLESIAGGIPDIEVELLPEAAPGTVILDNGSEILDASVPTQLEFLKEIMENSRRGKAKKE